MCTAVVCTVLKPGRTLCALSWFPYLMCTAVLCTVLTPHADITSGPFLPSLSLEGSGNLLGRLHEVEVTYECVSTTSAQQVSLTARTRYIKMWHSVSKT